MTPEFDINTWLGRTLIFLKSFFKFPYITVWVSLINSGNIPYGSIWTGRAWSVGVTYLNLFFKNVVF